MTKCDACPIAGECRSFPALCRRHAADPTRWRPALDAINAPPDAEPPAYPSLAKQAANALGSAARFVASGGATVSQEEYDRRKATCQACPTNRYVAAENRCEACGCYLAIKPWGKAERCPDGHW